MVPGLTPQEILAKMDYMHATVLVASRDGTAVEMPSQAIFRAVMKRCRDLYGWGATGPDGDLTATGRKALDLWRGR